MTKIHWFFAKESFSFYYWICAKNWKKKKGLCILKKKKDWIFVIFFSRGTFHSYDQLLFFCVTTVWLLNSKRIVAIYLYACQLSSYIVIQKTKRKERETKFVYACMYVYVPNETQRNATLNQVHTYTDDYVRIDV